MHSGFRRRKTALTLGALERDISGSADQTLLKSSFFATVEERREYVKKLVRIVSEDSKLSEAARSKLTELLCADTFDERRACNYARNCLLEAIGCPSAEWDLTWVLFFVQPKRSALKNCFYRLCVPTRNTRAPYALQWAVPNFYPMNAVRLKKYERQCPIFPYSLWKPEALR